MGAHFLVIVVSERPTRMANSRNNHRWRGGNPRTAENQAFLNETPDESAVRKAKAIEYYNRTAEHQRAEARDRIQKKRERNQQILVNYLVGKKCEDCPCDDPRLMTFDHREPDGKMANVADLVSRGAKYEYLVAEIQKCDVVCHNCHMIRMFSQRGVTYRASIKPISPADFFHRYGFPMPTFD